MPVPAVIANAAESFRSNNGFLARGVQDLSPEEWFKQPNETSNHMAWIVGHVIWARGAVLSRLGVQWTQPWLTQFARGIKLGDASQYPTPEELMRAWSDVSTVLHTALDNASVEALSQPATQGPPSADGKVSGVINFLAYHEVYHVGQASYLRGWLGHKGLMG